MKRINDNDYSIWNDKLGKFWVMKRKASSGVFTWELVKSFKREKSAVKFIERLVQ
jgi:hypothetical protein